MWNVQLRCRKGCQDLVLFLNNSEQAWDIHILSKQAEIVREIESVGEMRKVQLVLDIISDIFKYMSATSCASNHVPFTMFILCNEQWMLSWWSKQVWCVVIIGVVAISSATLFIIPSITTCAPDSNRNRHVLHNSTSTSTSTSTSSIIIIITIIIISNSMCLSWITFSVET